MILERFYEETITTAVSIITKQDGNMSSDSIRKEIDTAMSVLIDANGKRVRTKTTSSALTQIGFDKKYKKVLSDGRIIRIIKVDGEDYVEIVHDALCSVVANRLKEIADNALKKVKETEERKRKLLKRRILSALCIAVLLACAALWYYQFRPINVEVRLNEASIQNANLPPLRDAVVTLTLDDGDKVDTIYSIDNTINFSDIPIRYVGKHVHMGVQCPTYLPIDTTLLLTQNVCLNIFRDTSYYGKIAIRLWNSWEERYVTNATLEIDGNRMQYNQGVYSIDIPLEKQKTYYCVISTIPLENDTIYMPCGLADVLLTK